MKRDVENAADARMPGDAKEDAGAALTRSIRIKPSHRGSLHSAVGVPQGQKIPENKLQAALHSQSANLRKKAQFAKNAKSFKH